MDYSNSSKLANWNAPLFDHHLTLSTALGLKITSNTSQVSITKGFSNDTMQTRVKNVISIQEATLDGDAYTPGFGVGCITCSKLSGVLAKGYDLRNAPSCEWGQDIVLVAKTPSCITRSGIHRIERFINPRLIHVITTSYEKCSYFEAMSDRIRCYNENNIWEDLDYSKLRELFKQYHPDNEARWARRIGWYFQQLLKLGAAEYLGDSLTEHYMVWDADMVMLAPVYPTCYDDTSGKVRVVLECGGWRAPGYSVTYENLFGQRMKYPPIGSFVGHRMVVKKSLMLQLLKELKGNGRSWQENVVAHVDDANVYTGFSEYATYGSWMVKKHASEAYVKPRVTWIRNLEWEIPKSDPCCPEDVHFDGFFAKSRYGVNYVGVEVGHISDPKYGDAYKVCNSHDDKYKVAYGLPPPP